MAADLDINAWEQRFASLLDPELAARVSALARKLPADQAAELLDLADEIDDATRDSVLDEWAAVNKEFFKRLSEHLSGFPRFLYQQTDQEVCEQRNVEAQRNVEEERRARQ